MLNRRVSVVIPAYNAERYVVEAIESVLAQTHENVECIVVDDGSTDRTADVARACGSRVLVITQENRKLPEARNTGIRHATGEYLAFLDADDRIALQKIERQIAFLEEHLTFGAVYSRVRYFSDDKPGEFYTLKRPAPQGNILPSLVFGNFIPVHATLIKREAVDAIGGRFRQFPALEDWDFLLRLAISGCRFGLVDEELADYRVHPGGMSRDEILMFDAKLQVISTIAAESRDELRKHNLVPDAIVAYHRADLGKALLLNGRTEEGIAAISEAVRLSFPNAGKYRMLSIAARLFGSSPLQFLNSVTARRRKQR